MKPVKYISPLPPQAYALVPRGFLIFYSIVIQRDWLTCDRKAFPAGLNEINLFCAHAISHDEKNKKKNDDKK